MIFWGVKNSCVWVVTHRIWLCGIQSPYWRHSNIPYITFTLAITTSIFIYIYIYEYVTLLTPL